MKKLVPVWLLFELDYLILNHMEFQEVHSHNSLNLPIFYMVIILKSLSKMITNNLPSNLLQI